MIARMAKRLETVSLAVPMALLLGMALAFFLFAMPSWWLGRAVTLSGLPALIHAATPPLGGKARLLIACAGGLAGAAAVWALFRWLERPVHVTAWQALVARDDAEAAEDRALPQGAAAPEVGAPEGEATFPAIPQGGELAGPEAEAEAAPHAVSLTPPLIVATAAPGNDDAGRATVPAPAVTDAAPVAAEPALEATADAASPEGEPAPTPAGNQAPARPWSRWLPTAILARRAEPQPDGAPTLRRADAHPDAPARRPIFAAADLGAPLDTGGAAWAANASPEAEPAAPLLLDAAWQTRGPEAAPARGTIRAADPREQASAAVLMARLEAALAAKPGRPASPPAQGEALREAMAELRKTRIG